MTDHSQPEIELLRTEVATLSRRVRELEFLTGVAQRPAPARPAPAPIPVPAPQPASAPLPPPQAELPPPPAYRAAPVKRDPLVPAINWSHVVEQLFTARTLAWAGGAATALGVILLFVMAASRGWVTPEMRVGLGVIVSVAILAGAIELDRRTYRSDAILAAAGAGIAGLYASLWASTSLYAFFGDAIALPLAAAIAAVAVVVAIRVKQEPLAIFGIGAAMVAPVLVSHEVSAGGLLFTAVMAAAALPLCWRFRWQNLLITAWAVPGLQAAWLALSSHSHTGMSLAVVDIELVAGLIVGMLFMVELRRYPRPALSALGWPLASSAFALSLAGVFLFAGSRDVSGHSEAGLGLLGLAAAWAAIAAVPTLLRRSHPDLTDILGAFALTSVAAATGLLLGGPGVVCAWAAESLLIVAAAERIGRRGAQRQHRLQLAASVYLLLAVVRTIALVVPTVAHLASLGQGSTAGAIALAAVAIAGVGLCFGVRWLPAPVRLWLWFVPGLAIGYLPAWVLHAEWAVLAYAGLTAAVFVYRRSPLMVRWLPTPAAIAIGAGYWAAGALVALVVTAPLHEFGDSGWDAFGAHHGLPGLVALLAAAGVLAWSVRRPLVTGAEYVVLLPFVTLAYLIAEAAPLPYTIWAWLGVAAATALAVHVPAVRSRLGEGPLLAVAAGFLALGIDAAWAYNGSLAAIGDHGRSEGWASIALATAAALAVAGAVRKPQWRAYAMWVPAALLMQLCAMLLPGQYPLVAWAGISVALSALVVVWPRPIAARLALRPMLELTTVIAAGLTVLVLAAYETPAMVFETNHDPASGLAAAAAATVALLVAAYAASRAAEREQWAVAGHPVWKALVYTGGAMALWTLAAALIGGEQLRVSGGDAQAVKDGFQQGQVLVSISWVLVGLGLVVASLRSGNRRLRAAAIALLFVALGKLFLYDLAFLTAMARAVSFIVTGIVLLVAALLLQRFAPQVRAAATGS